MDEMRIRHPSNTGEPCSPFATRTLRGTAIPRRAPRPIEYVLAIPTNGRPCLRDTLESFRESVTPQPTSVLVFVDTPDGIEEWGGGTPWNAVTWRTNEPLFPVGFCAATRELWLEASYPASHDFVFWLEDDFTFERELDLAPLAGVLDSNPHLAQMALMRGPANDLERKAGGCRELRPRDYREMDEGTWLESRTNFSTGCSLIGRRFMEANPWPAYADSCEGRFSIDLLAAGFRFGVWGLGEPWVKHNGVRAGFGY